MLSHLRLRLDASSEGLLLHWLPRAVVVILCGSEGSLGITENAGSSPARHAHRMGTWSSENTLAVGSMLTDHPEIYNSEVRDAEVDDIHGLS